MTLNGSQITNGLGAKAGNTANGVTAKAISNVASKNDSKSENNIADEVAATGKGEEKNQLLTADHGTSRLKAALANANNLGLATALPPGMFGSKFNPYLSFFPSGFGMGGSGNGWNGLAVANGNINYRGPGGGSDPAGGGYMGAIKLFDGKEKPNNITVLGASDSGSVAFGTGAGTIIAEQISARIAKGQNLGSILNNLDGKTMSVGDGQYQTPHVTNTATLSGMGSGLSDATAAASSNNRVTGTGIILVGEDGSGYYHVGTSEGANKMEVAMRAVGLNVVRVGNEAEYEKAVRDADASAKAAGGNQLLWVHAEAHGNSNRNDGGHSMHDEGFVSVGGAIHEFNLVGRAAEANKSHQDVLVTTGACHSGAIDAHGAFKHLDAILRAQITKDPLPEKTKITEAEPKKENPTTQPVLEEKKVAELKSEPKKEDTTLIAERTNDEVRKKELDKLEVEIA